MAEQRARTANLTAVLVAIALGELVLHRVADRLFAPVGTRLTAVGALGWFLFHLAGVLGVLVLVAGLAGALRRRELFPRPMRVAVFVIGGVFIVLAGMRIVMPAKPGFLPHLFIGFAFFSFTIVAGLLGTGASWRAKLGVLLMAFPGVLHATAAITRAAEGDLHSPPVSPETLSSMGEYLLLLAALAGPFLLASPARPGARWRWSAGVGAVAAAVAGYLLFTHADAVQTVAFYTVHLDVPSLPSIPGVLFVLAFGAYTASVVQLLGARGGSRLAGYGLVLIAVAGYQATNAVELVLAATGMLALALGELRAAAQPAESEARRLTRVVTAAEWQRTVAEIAEQLGAPGAPAEHVEVEEEGRELVRVRARRGERPLSLRIVRVHGHVAELELLLGEPGHGEPDVAVASRAARNTRALQRSAGAVLAPASSGDPALDRAAASFGRMPALDAELAAGLGRLTGLVMLWSGRAVRYQAAFPSADPERDPLAPDHAADGLRAEEAVLQARASAARVVAIVETLAALLEASSRQPVVSAPASE